MGDWAFWLPLIATASGLPLSAWVSGWRRAQPWAAWALHAGVWLVVCATLTSLLGRPLFAVTSAMALWLTVALVDRAKRSALCEPFVMQDFEFFVDVLRHPRLYLPFLGWAKFLGAAAAFAAAIAIGWWLEAVPQPRDGQWAALGILYALGTMLLLWGHTRRLAIICDPSHDMSRLGLTACVWRYAQEARRPSPPIVRLARMTALHPARAAQTWPHLVAVQSESFFDPRTLYPGIRRDVLATHDALAARSPGHGPLRVPAWGANTVRSEFSFLAGEDLAALGVHRFQPYWAMKRGLAVTALPGCLRQLGYRTVAVHPYAASFYSRDTVFPRLGFERFVDLGAFAGAVRSGPFISDMAVADTVRDLLHATSEPLFVFVITMENHGPLHLEQVTDGEIAQLYDRPPPVGCEDLGVYLRHLRNADRMLAHLHTTLAGLSRPASLCWYGDHVPIMPTVYRTFGKPDGETPYLIWSSDGPDAGTPPRSLAIQDLVPTWLRLAGVMEPEAPQNP